MHNIIKAEFYKLKRLPGLHLVYGFPLVITLISVIIFIHDRSSGLIAADANPYFVLTRRFYLMFYSFLSPIILMLIYYSILQVEFKNRSWENLYILAGSKQKIYRSKIIVGMAVTLLYVLASFVFILLAHLAMRMLFHNNFDYGKFTLSRELLLYPEYLITYWMLCIIIFNYFLYIENAILSVGCMTFILIFCAITLRSHWKIYSPFSYPYMVEGTYIVPKMSKDFLLYSVILIPLFYIAGLYLYIKLFKPKR